MLRKLTIVCSPDQFKNFTNMSVYILDGHGGVDDDVDSGSSSDDNLFDVQEWKQTKSRLQREEESKAEHLDHAFAADVERNYSFRNLENVAAKPFANNGSWTNLQCDAKSKPQQQRAHKRASPSLSSSAHSSRYSLPANQPVLPAQHNQFSQSMSDHVANNDLLLDDIINDMAVSSNNQQHVHVHVNHERQHGAVAATNAAPKGTLASHPLAEPDYVEHHADDSHHDELDVISNKLDSPNGGDNPDDDIVNYINNLNVNPADDERKEEEKRKQQQDEVKQFVLLNARTEEEEKYNIALFSRMDCDSIQRCKPLQRIITCLHFYRNVIGGALAARTGLIVQYFNNYPHFLDDYYHILSQHLNQKKTDNEKNFELIYAKISKHVHCELTKCDSYLRLNRDRQSEDDQASKSMRDLDVNVSFYVNMMDTLHCYFLHSYDCGYRVDRIKLTEFSQFSAPNGHDQSQQRLSIASQSSYRTRSSFSQQSNNFNPLLHAIIDDEQQKKKLRKLHHDEELKNLQLYVYQKRAELLCSKGANFMEMNKFNNKFCTRNNNAKKGKEKGDVQQQQRINNGTSFGIKCYFWDYYKEKEEADPFNVGYRYKDFYIAKKYDNLKQEIRRNGGLSAKQYNVSYYKALSFMNTRYVRSAIQTENNFADYHTKQYVMKKYKVSEANKTLHCEIEHNSPITVEHLLALILYTDYLALAYNLKQSFYKIHNEAYQETDEHFKARKRDYWHWTKLMMECVEIYGEWISSSKYDVFYTGISEAYVFNEFSCNFIAPLSVTTELPVASMYCAHKNGYLLELTRSSCSSSAVSLFVKSFNCSFLSSFAFEHEFVFLGGCINGASLRISSIRSLRHNVNCSYFIRSITIFQKALSALYLDGRFGKISKIDCKMIEQLIAYRFAKPKDAKQLGAVDVNYNYMNKCFAAMLQNQHRIELNMNHIKTMYRRIKQYFIVSSSNSSLSSSSNLAAAAGNKNVFNSDFHNNGRMDIVCFEWLAKLCPNCTEIQVEMQDSKNLIFQRELHVLLQVVVRITHLQQSVVVAGQAPSKLETITLCNIGNQYEENAIKQFQANLNKMDWDLSISKIQQQQMNYAHHNKLPIKYKYKYILYKKQKENLATKFMNIFLSK